jgi:hypothetical protein
MILILDSFKDKNACEMIAKVAEWLSTSAAGHGSTSLPRPL